MQLRIEFAMQGTIAGHGNSHFATECEVRSGPADSGRRPLGKNPDSPPTKQALLEIDWNLQPLVSGDKDRRSPVADVMTSARLVGGDPQHFFPPLPADRVAVGFLTGDTTPTIVSQALDYIITGNAPPGCKYKLREPAGYPGMIGKVKVCEGRNGNLAIE